MQKPESCLGGVAPYPLSVQVTVFQAVDHPCHVGITDTVRVVQRYDAVIQRVF